MVDRQICLFVILNFHLTEVFSRSICPIIVHEVCAYVCKRSVFMEKCLYNIYLLEQAFNGKVLGKLGSGEFKTGNESNRKHRGYRSSNS